METEATTSEFPKKVNPKEQDCENHSLSKVIRENFRSPPLDTKAPGPPLIYLVGPLAISDPQDFPQVGSPPSGFLKI